MRNLWSKFFNKFVNRGGSPFLYLRKWFVMALTWRVFLLRRKVGAELASKITSEDMLVVNRVHSTGYAMFESQPALTQELIDESQRLLNAYIAERSADSMSNMGLSFMASLLSKNDMTAESIFVRFASQPRLLSMASKYLGTSPYLSDISLIYSFDTTESPAATQIWHRDYDDTRMFKIFVYCSDVPGPAAGALHVAHKNAVKGIYATPLYCSRRYPDAKFFKMAKESDTTALCGPAGTTFICDTHQSYHYGSRCTDRPRLACFITYQTYTGLYQPGKVVEPPLDAALPLKLLLARAPSLAANSHIS